MLSNPTEKPEMLANGAAQFFVTTGDLSIDQDVFLTATTFLHVSEPNVNTTIKGHISVCGFDFVASDPDNLLTIEKQAPDLVEDVKTVNLLDLFDFETPHAIIEPLNCMFYASICDATGN